MWFKRLELYQCFHFVLKKLYTDCWLSFGVKPLNAKKTYIWKNRNFRTNFFHTSNLVYECSNKNKNKFKEIKNSPRELLLREQNGTPRKKEGDSKVTFSLTALVYYESMAFGCPHLFYSHVLDLYAKNRIFLRRLCFWLTLLSGVVMATDFGVWCWYKLASSKIGLHDNNSNFRTRLAELPGALLEKKIVIF